MVPMALLIMCYDFMATNLPMLAVERQKIGSALGSLGASITLFFAESFREANANLSECTLIKQRARQSIVVTSNTSELHRWQDSTGASATIIRDYPLALLK